MFESYMFIPANKKKYIDKSKMLINLNHRIFDFEDSILQSNLDIALGNLYIAEIKESDWARIPIKRFDQIAIVEKISKLGINNYIIPKFEGYPDFKRIYSDIMSVNPYARMILLIENAIAYLEFEKILKEFRESIHGISLGIHDFSFETGMKNDYRLLSNIRINIMLIAKAYSVTPIDVVSMHLKDYEKLKAEIMDGFNLGYRSKFLIHPNQLEVLNSIEFYSLDEVKEFNDVLEYYNRNIAEEEALFSFNDKVYERMHIEEIKKIVEWGNSFYGSDWSIL